MGLLQSWQGSPAAEGEAAAEAAAAALMRRGLWAEGPGDCSIRFATRLLAAHSPPCCEHGRAPRRARRCEALSREAAACLSYR